MKDSTFAELSSLFFTTRQIIRSQLPGGHPDPNAWLRCETMHFIATAKNPTMQDVAAYLRVRAPSATSLISNLAKSGFVSRQGEKGDRRVVRILLTKAGEKVLRDYAKTSATTMRKVFSKLDTKEVEQLTATVRRLREIHRT